MLRFASFATDHTGLKRERGKGFEPQHVPSRALRVAEVVAWNAQHQ
jgi:hypothetical protein